MWIGWWLIHPYEPVCVSVKGAGRGLAQQKAQLNSSVIMPLNFRINFSQKKQQPWPNSRIVCYVHWLPYQLSIDQPSATPLQAMLSHGPRYQHHNQQHKTKRSRPFLMAGAFVRPLQSNPHSLDDI